jgi:hypothetical protein
MYAELVAGINRAYLPADHRLGCLMRIKIIRKPAEGTVDGIDLQRFAPGFQYEVGSIVGGLLLAEGWAALVTSDEPAMLIPMVELHPDGVPENPPNLVREIYPPYFDGPRPRLAHATDRPRTSRKRRRPRV